MTRARRDPALFVLALLASVVGVVFIFDAGYARSLAGGGGVVPVEARQQLLFLAVSLLAYLGVARVPGTFWRKLAGPLWAVTLLVLLSVDFVGVEQNEARRWISVGPVNVQPSEFAKLALVLYLAAAFASRAPWKPRPHRNWAGWCDHIALPKLKRWVPFGLALLGVMFVEQGRDLGTAAVLLAISVVLVAVGGASRSSLAIGAVVLTIGVGGLLLKQPYRMERITNHFHRWDPKNVDDIGFQTTLAERAIAEGGPLGVGMGNGQVKHVIPAPTTDFIMATVGEETGFVGSAFVLLLMAALTFRLLWLAKGRDRFSALVLVGTAGWLGVQTCTNLMMANATLPAIGIPVPFVSSGGSSLIALWLAMGVCQSVLNPTPARAKEVADARRPDRWRDGRARLSGA